MMRLPIHKPNDPDCRCVTNHYKCDKCKAAQQKEFYRTATPEQYAYDQRQINKAMGEWPDDADLCCTCHINPPCGYCMEHCADCRKHQDDCECDHAPILSTP